MNNPVYLKQLKIDTLLVFAENYVIYPVSKCKENPLHSYTGPEDSRRLRFAG